MSRRRLPVPPPSAVSAGLVAVALVGTLGCASLMLSRIYDGPLAPRLLLGAAAASVALGLVTSRAPSWSAAPVSVLGLTGYTALAVRLSAGAGDVTGGVLDLTRDAVRNGLPRILTAMIPIRPDPDTIVLPVLAVWLAGLAAVELALRSRRVLLAYGPVAALAGAALYLVGPNARPTVWLPLAYAGFAALGLAAGSGPPGSAAGSGPPGAAAVAGITGRERSLLRIRMTAGALGGLFAIMVAAAGLGPAVADRVTASPSDPRRYVTPPRLDSLDESPLARLSGWALDPDQHLFDVRLGGDRPASGTGTRIRLAVLGDYDGVTWRVGGTYRTAGRVLSGPQARDRRDADGGDRDAGDRDTNGRDAADADADAGDSDAGDRDPGNGSGREVSQQITIDQLGGRLLPAAATPTLIEGVRAAYDPRTTTLALPEGLRPGVSYRVVSRQPTVEVNLLPTATVPTDETTVRRFVRLAGDAPDDQRRLAEQLAEGATTPYQRALAVERFLAEHYRQVADAPSGHAYPNLSFFLFGPRDGGGQRGTSEQFAAAFAVLARMLGLPSRVVVGFAAEPGRRAVRGADAFAWPEVRFSGLGWVAFNPLPEPNTRPRNVEDDFRPSPDPTTPPPSTQSTPPAPSASSASPPATTGDAGTSGPGTGDGPTTVAVAAAVALLLIGASGAVPLARRARRRRSLWAGDPSSRVLGAWWEVLDSLRQAGRRAPGSLAASELSGYAERAAGGRSGALDELARLVNIVAFAPTTVSARQADGAADDVTGYLAALRAGLPRWRRLLWPLDPRPLWWEWRRGRRRGLRAPAPGGPAPGGTAD